jgi:hypothetical protein
MHLKFAQSQSPSGRPTHSNDVHAEQNPASFKQNPSKRSRKIQCAARHSAAIMEESICERAIRRHMVSEQQLHSMHSVHNTFSNRETYFQTLSTLIVVFDAFHIAILLCYQSGSRTRTG